MAFSIELHLSPLALAMSAEVRPTKKLPARLKDLQANIQRLELQVLEAASMFYLRSITLSGHS